MARLFYDPGTPQYELLRKWYDSDMTVDELIAKINASVERAAGERQPLMQLRALYTLHEMAMRDGLVCELDEVILRQQAHALERWGGRTRLLTEKQMRVILEAVVRPRAWRAS